jgi:predicted MPP superfamily phosphohydrolase
MSFEFGAFCLPLVRRERIALNVSHPLRLLYASDLHLGHWWTARVAEHLVVLAGRTSPDVILLGGDLVDRRRALEPMQSMLRSLTKLAPTYAIPGNHDLRVGVAALRVAVLAAGGHWLPDGLVERGLTIEGVLSPPRCHSESRILCAHAPAIFPAAARAGYRLVLAGHLHGGQCVLATHKGKQYPAAWFHRWHGLRFDRDDSTLLVSRGMADTLPLRLNCPREVLLCEIV